jgi:hypothetical protein
MILADITELEQEIQQWDTFFPVGHPAREELDHGLNMKRELYRQIRAEVESRDFATVESVIQRYRELKDLQNLQGLSSNPRHDTLPAPAPALPPPPPSFPPPPPPPSESSTRVKPSQTKKSKGWRTWFRSWFSRGHN